MNISNFKILKLFNNNYKIDIKDNTLIIIADNGSGKTTLLRVFYFFLTKQWAKLIEYDFDEIIVTINKKKYSFEKKAFENNVININNYKHLATKYNNYSKFILEEFINYDINDLKSNLYKIDEIEQNFDVPKNLIITLIDSLESAKFDDKVYDWNSNIIFLPTYRRIEKDYFSIYGDVNKRVANYVINLFPEIEDKIHREKKYNNSSETEEDLNRIFSSIIDSRNTEKWNKTKSNTERLEMIEFGMTDVSFRLKEFCETVSSERRIIVNEFVELINKYFNKSKRIIFDNEQHELFVENINSKCKLSLKDLSSGEKQLVSLFSHLFFDEKKPFVIIDEPEISLSIAWQEMLINDIKSFSQGLIIATHSPFIVNKSLKENTCGINEFLRNE